MIENEFIVGNDKKKVKIESIGIWVLILVCYLLRGISTVGGAYLGILGVWLFSLLLNMKNGYESIIVKGKSITVERKLGRSYTFRCEDIKKVDYHIVNSTRYGTRNYILIYYNQKPIYMESSLLGFSEMARYLLKQREDGVIQKSVFPSKVVKALNGYSKFDEPKLNKEELKEQIDIIKNAPCLKDFNDEVKLKSLLGLSSSVQDTNCCFIAYQDANKVFYNTDDVIFDAYEGYLINKTENGLMMIPFMYQKRIFLKSKVDFCGVLEQYRYLISNEEVEKITVRGGRGKSLYASIDIKLEDRTIYLLANTKEPKISYHNDGLAKFVEAYTI